MISIDGLHAFSETLAKLDADASLRGALEQAAARLAEAVRDALSHAPGSGHATPLLQAGTLHDSIDHATQADRAVIGSTDPVAVDQELGTAHVPPRPFLASTAAVMAPEIAASIGAALAHALRGGE